MAEPRSMEQTIADNEQIMSDLETLRAYTSLSSQIVSMVADSDRVIEALGRLSKAPKFLIARWSDPNYG